MLFDVHYVQAVSVEVLKDAATLKNITNILKTNLRVAVAVGHGYISQLGHIYLDLLNVYKVR